MAKRQSAAWDLTALLNAADPKSSLAERHLWLIRLMEWLRHAPLDGDDERATPTPVLRLKHLMGVLDRHPEHQARVAEVLREFWIEIDSAALLADFGFAPRMDLWGELARRLRTRLLPLTPATTDLGDVFALLFPHPGDATWLRAIDDETLARLRDRVAPAHADGAADSSWRSPFFDAIVFLASSVRASAFSPAIRQRMSPELLVDRPFRQLAHLAEQLGERAQEGEATLLQQVQYLRALLDACRRCADSVHDHLEAHGVSVDIVFEIDQMRERTHRIDALITCIVSPEPAREVAHLMADLVQTADERRSIRALLAQHYSLLARKVAERSAATGEHYITRTFAEYRQMLAAAFGGGAVLAVTTFIKFALLAIPLSAFWGGFWAGVNYAASFVLVQLLHFTVATKQPAMTAPAMAEKLADVSDDAKVDSFVDEVAHLIRSQAAGIFGNLGAVIPVVLLAQAGAQLAFGAPLIDRPTAQHVMQSLTLLGPTAFYAAFTGIVLFASSLIAGWFENWFVWHRLDSAITWNPRFIAVLGAARARRWGVWWRANISGFAANISLGLMLGIIPVLAKFFGVPLDVRHVTLSTGQLAAALGTEGLPLLQQSAFWWCAAGIPVTAALNLGVSFLLAFRVALRSRGIRLADRSRIYRAIRARMWRRPFSFLLPGRTAA